MQWRAGPEWDHIDQPTLEEVEKSWAHSRCREVKFDISGTTTTVCVGVGMGGCVWLWMCYSTHKTLLLGLVHDIQYPVRGRTLDATIKLLCAAVRGIIQRKDPFVLKSQVKDEQVSRLVEDKCAVTRTERKDERGFDTVTLTVLELKPMYSCACCDHLIHGTICKHIHLVAQTISTKPVQPTPVKHYILVVTLFVTLYP